MPAERLFAFKDAVWGYGYPTETPVDDGQDAYVLESTCDARLAAVGAENERLRMALRIAQVERDPLTRPSADLIDAGLAWHDIENDCWGSTPEGRRLIDAALAPRTDTTETST